MKRALLVGINNYRAGKLFGCLNDVQMMGQLIVEKYAFSSAMIRVLLDADATKQAILDGLKWLIASSLPGDVAFFHYSGHGTWMKDRDGDEADARDEALVPIDYETAGFLNDDELHKVVGRVQQNVNLTIVLDSCFSGGSLRELMMVDPLGPRAQARFLDISPVLSGESRIPSVPNILRNPIQWLRYPIGVRTPVGSRIAGEHRALLLSAGRSDQEVADAYINGDYHGAHTYGLNVVIRHLGPMTVAKRLNAELRGWQRDHHYEQVPQIQGDLLLRNRPLFTSR